MSSLQTVTATILTNQSLSDQVTLLGPIASIAIPPDLEGSILSFQETPDNGASFLEVNRDGNPVDELVVAGTFAQIDSTFWSGSTAIKVRTGTADRPVVQSAQREIVIYMRVG